MNREGAHKIEMPKPIQSHAATNRSVTQLLVQFQTQDPAGSPVPAASAESQKLTHLAQSVKNDFAKELEQFSRGLAPWRSSHNARCNKGEDAGALERRQEHMNHLTRHLHGFCQFRTSKFHLAFFKTRKILFLLLSLVNLVNPSQAKLQASMLFRTVCPWGFNEFSPAHCYQQEKFFFSFPLLPCCKCLPCPGSWSHLYNVGVKWTHKQIRKMVQQE